MKQKKTQKTASGFFTGKLKRKRTEKRKWDAIQKRIKPKEKIEFYSNYMQVDDHYECVLTYFYQTSLNATLGKMWGLCEIPVGLDEKGDGIRTVIYEQIHPMSPEWTKAHLVRADNIEKNNLEEQANSGSTLGRMKAGSAYKDLEEINEEILNGANYLNVKKRIIVKALTLESLEEAVEEIRNSLKNSISFTTVASSAGTQRKEISSIYQKNEEKLTKGQDYTSTEYAGTYSLVNQGFEDPEGIYIGDMEFEVNRPGIIFDFNRFSRRAVIATSKKERGIPMTDLWAAAISQDIRQKGGRVIHVVLTNSNVTEIGLPYKKSTIYLDMTEGMLNPMEFFGEIRQRGDAQKVYNQQIEKMKLFFRQFYHGDEEFIRSMEPILTNWLTDFYKEIGMWRTNQNTEFDDTRLIVPHEDVRRLSDFMATMTRKVQESDLRPGDYESKRSHTIFNTFDSVLKTSSATFDCLTSPVMDETKKAQRIIYDFSHLYHENSKEIAMGQLINVLSYASNDLREGDCLIIHGTDLIDPNIREWMNSLFAKMEEKNARVVMLYRDIRKCIRDSEFNRFTEADYTIFGTMDANTALEYEKAVGTKLPENMREKISDQDMDYALLRRGITNVIMVPNLFV